MKIIRKIKKGIKAVIFTVLLLLIAINLPIISLKNEESTNDFSNWMSESLSSETKVKEVKMIGAHDAFSKDINLFSKVDELSAPSIMTGIPGTLIKGFLVRQSVTQIAETNKLLSSGVRYLDIRLTKTGDVWKTKHNFIASDFKPIVEDIALFLDENPGEFLVLDFQHIHGVNYDSASDYTSFYLMLEDYGLIDYSYYDDSSIENLTYGEVTSDKTLSRVLIVDKFEVNGKSTYNYDETIRSSWANSDSFEDVVEFLEAERLIIEGSSNNNGFNVMQAVTTMSMSPNGIINSFKTWSLVERAERFNEYLLDCDNLELLMESMPIVMVDYATDKEFVDEIMELIIDLNQG
ncbi:hypothetical protein CI105_06150 [Candidatus Izimaplasma bacterium ZiA1]|uniref:hypothetical protein n=1 Tax=Candidatus Izimoplasma sp. ZiA1 TaxID=2024899 RepID=UPI000BAA3A10|nr:hypothetical protein CI105_06150 [Candidatus Izimaplasma bacterium ZiA1]